jgi:hypothetical protein
MLGWARPRHFGFGGLTKDETYRSGSGSSAGSHETRHGLHPGCGWLCRRQATVGGKRGEEGFGNRKGRGLHRQGITKGGICRGGNDELGVGTWNAGAAGAFPAFEAPNAQLENIRTEKPHAPYAVSSAMGN